MNIDLLLCILGMALVGMLVFLLMWGAKADGYETETE